MITLVVSYDGPYTVGYRKCTFHIQRLLCQMNLSIIKIVNKIVKASKVSGYIVDPRSKDEELAAKEIKKYERKAARMIGRWAGVQVTGCLFYILQRNI